MSAGQAVDISLLATIPRPGLLFGFMLAAAVLGGYAARWVKVPRVVGYLLFGIGLKWLLQSVLDPAGSPENAPRWLTAEQTLRPIKDLALGLILFSIGGVFETRHLKSVGTRVLKISLMEIVLTIVLVFVGCGIALAITNPGKGISEYLPLALLLGIAGIATAPAATLFVLREYDAKGPMTDTILSLTGVNNVVCITLFYVAFLVLSSTGSISSDLSDGHAFWLPLLTTLVGSLVLGVAFGVALSIFHSKVPVAEMVLIFLAVYVVLGNGEKWLLEHQGMSYNFLLTALVMGAVFSNVALDPEKLETSLKLVGVPIFAGFFVMAGYELHLNELLHLGVVGVVYILCRLVAKWLGCRLGSHWAGATDTVRPDIGLGLLCQAAVVIGLADYVRHHWQHPFGGTFATVVLGSVVVFELIGPLLIKWLVVGTGEVKAISLLRRRTPAAAEGVSITRLTLNALLRTIGLGRKPSQSSTEPLQVKHIIRTNIRFLRASATMDEVLHFVEHSRYNHFPVIGDEDELLGVIHFSDLRTMIYDPNLRDLVTAVDMADPNTRVVDMETPLPELLDAFREEGSLGALPVVAHAGSRRLLGVVEQRDLLRALHLSRDESNTGP
ncbi:MAG: cation:proton antiporter [Phycisphaerae bacterium]|nr:cation:proton antiporter [Phycisphaerae bacterium]